MQAVVIRLHGQDSWFLHSIVPGCWGQGFCGGPSVQSAWSPVARRIPLERTPFVFPSCLLQQRETGLVILANTLHGAKSTDWTHLNTSVFSLMAAIKRKRQPKSQEKVFLCFPDIISGPWLCVTNVMHLDNLCSGIWFMKKAAWIKCKVLCVNSVQFLGLKNEYCLTACSKSLQFCISCFFKRLPTNIVWDQHLTFTFSLLLFLQANCHKEGGNHGFGSQKCMIFYLKSHIQAEKSYFLVTFIADLWLCFLH